MKSIRLKFITEAGKNLYVTMNYADDSLAEDGGAEKVQAAVDAVLEHQPFEQLIVKCESAELIDRNVTEVELTPAG